MPEVIVLSGISLLIGAAIARWWLTLVPITLTLAWVAHAAVGGGADSDGMPDWQIAMFFGLLVSLMTTGCLIVGVVWGRYVRERWRGARSGFPL